MVEKDLATWPKHFPGTQAQPKLVENWELLVGVKWFLSSKKLPLTSKKVRFPRSLNQVLATTSSKYPKK
ncbi:UNVERIFIED_CONTAM: hypothetical protein GTU68_012504 [Idotea baltica]|nr:hypothetical protein [Idotea baltica]